MKIHQSALITASLFLLMAGCDRGGKALERKNNLVDFARSYSIPFILPDVPEPYRAFSGPVESGEYIRSTKTLIIVRKDFDDPNSYQHYSVTTRINIDRCKISKESLSIIPGTYEKIKNITVPAARVCFEASEPGAVICLTGNGTVITGASVYFPNDQKADEFIAMLERERERP